MEVSYLEMWSTKRGGERQHEMPAFQEWPDTWVCFGCCYPSSAQYVYALTWWCVEVVSGPLDAGLKSMKGDLKEKKKESHQEAVGSMSWRDISGRITCNRPSGLKTEVATVFAYMGDIALASLYLPSTGVQKDTHCGYWGWPREGDFGEAGQKWKVH